MGKLRTGTKSDLLGCLEDLDPSQGNLPSPRVQVNIVDRAAIYDLVLLKLFLVTQNKCSHHTSYLSCNMSAEWMSCGRKYFPESLKAETHSKRGKGIRRHVEPRSAIPGNWKEFLRIEVGWEVHWTTLPEAIQACRELLKCGCKKGYSKGKCKYVKAALYFATVVDYMFSELNSYYYTELLHIDPQIFDSANI